ncbi:fimbrial protein [Pseudomonas tructae]|uniref:Fimbrial protein n=1 Tax=Pseudomonas tructae TaxID=2518644 RepID=A0A411MJ98_9PSED|nr:fimbrial protein [Pseudomonas tructae]QBF26865.1 fimbrial protein [Pseudomonas tructae]
MKYREFIFAALFFLIWIPKSYALKCEQKGTALVSDSYLVNTSVAIPNQLPAGTILYRQPSQTVEVLCWVDINGQSEENIYFYVNPRNVSVGDDIEIGVTYEGNDYLSSALAGGKLDIGWSVRGCPNELVCGSQKESKTMTYSIFFAKKSPAGASKEGPLISMANYMAFQFDGKGGVRPGKSYNLTVKGLDRFRYVPCVSSIDIFPGSINFGRFTSSSAKVGEIIKEVPFVVSERRSCDAVYGVDGYLEPMNAVLSEDMTILLPSNNKSVGISIFKGSGQQAVKFREEFELTPKTSPVGNSAQFTARLQWMTDTPILGGFDAGAIVNIFYK